MVDVIVPASQVNRWPRYRTDEISEQPSVTLDAFLDQRVEVHEQHNHPDNEQHNHSDGDTDNDFFHGRYGFSSLTRLHNRRSPAYAQASPERGQIIFTSTMPPISPERMMAEPSPIPRPTTPFASFQRRAFCPPLETEIPSTVFPTMNQL